jgi:hypothetical protein
MFDVLLGYQAGLLHRLWLLVPLLLVCGHLEKAGDEKHFDVVVGEREDGNKCHQFEAFE